jgi:hypothetical protein
MLPVCDHRDRPTPDQSRVGEKAENSDVRPSKAFALRGSQTLLGNPKVLYGMHRKGKRNNLRGRWSSVDGWFSDDSLQL